MTYKTLVVHLDAAKRCAERLGLAVELAAAFDSTLVGVFALEAMRIPGYALAEAPTREVIEFERQARAEAARAAEAQFRAAVARRPVKSEWRESARDPLDAMLLSARYADLLIAGQPEAGSGDARSVRPTFAADLVLEAGRPVLFVPYAGHFSAAGERIFVAWNATREAARALTDSLPLLKRAQAVDVVVFDAHADSAHGQMPGADIALYLARHGVKVNVSQQSGTGIEVGEQILSRAADFQADLIVMGAYGHSRMRQLILGGATSTLLESMTVPVLMSH